MSYLEVSLKLDEKEYPMLINFKKKELGEYLLKIFKTGYQIHFPSSNKIEQQLEYNELIERIENIKHEIKGQISNSDLGDKINNLENSLTKLIGISSNSFKKGNFGENLLEEIFNKRYGDIMFERKSQTPHSGDAWLHLPDNKIIMLESKNYTNTVNKDEIIKLQNDMITHHIKWGILASFNSMIQGMKELDYHIFTHNNEIYSVIMISNLTSDISKLDLGLQIIRKLMCNLDNFKQFPWIQKDITQSLNELSEIVQKNYLLRDSYYNMERDMQKLLSNYHTTLRNYQYDIEQKINELSNKIKSTINESIENEKLKPILTYQTIIEKYQDKKILPIIIRFVDIVQFKNWIINYSSDSSEWSLIDKITNDEKCKFKILAKKISITLLSNDLILNLHLGKEKENKENFEIIKNIK